MADKKFFRVRLSNKSSVDKKMVNGVFLDKKWQIKSGEIGDLNKFQDVEAEVMIKQGNGFILASAQTKNAEEVQKEPQISPALNALLSDFDNMTADQLKNYLVDKGVDQKELRNASKSEMKEKAEYLWSQS